MPFKMQLKVYTPWCLLLALSCSTVPQNSLSIFNPTGEYIVRLQEGETITGIKDSSEQGAKVWTSAQLQQILGSIKIMGKISATETLLISDPSYSDIGDNCDDDCTKGQSWIYDETENTLVPLRKVEGEGDSMSYADNPEDIELDQDKYYTKSHRKKKESEDDNAYEEYKKGSRYYWVGKDDKGDVYWVQSNHKERKRSGVERDNIRTEDQCPGNANAKKSKKHIAVKYSIKDKEENSQGFWVRRNINECLYDGQRKPKILYMDADSLIIYTSGSIIYFNPTYPNGMLIPPSESEEEDANEFITGFLDDADSIQAGLGERDSFWLKKGTTALMFHKSADEEDHVLFNYTKFELKTEDKMALWVDREADGDADQRVKIDNKIIYIEGGELKSTEKRLITKAYEEISNDETDEEE